MPKRSTTHLDPVPEITTSVENDNREFCPVDTEKLPETEKCNMCDYELTSSELMQEHVYQNHKMPCSSCALEFTDKSHLQRHINAIHSVEMPIQDAPHTPDITVEHFTPFKCDLCGLTFPSKLLFHAHTNTWHIDVQAGSLSPVTTTVAPESLHDVPYRPQLSPIIELVEDYELEENSNEVEDCTWKCVNCSFESATENDLTRHNNTSHKQSHLCNYCGLSYDTESDLVFHINMHQQIVEFPCNHCEFIGSEALALIDHTRSVHRPTEGITCKFCNLYTKNSEVLQDHILERHSIQKEVDINGTRLNDQMINLYDLSLIHI